MMFKNRWLKKEKLKAVHDNDLSQFLSSIGGLEQIINGQHHCKICDIKITLENLGAIYPKGNKINFACNRLSCLTEIELMREDTNG